MPKRKVRFAEGEEDASDVAALEESKRRKEEGVGADEEDTYEGEGTESALKEDHESKHTLESDEEEEEKYERLDIETVEGQEDSTVGDFEGDTKITPFNMKDEMGEGHFDSTGNFIFDKKNEELKDAWLDSIDWAKIKKDAGDLWEKPSDEIDGTNAPMNKLSLYSQMLEFLNPKETVAKALSRLGGGSTSSANRKRRWEQKKREKGATEGEKSEEEKKVLELTGVVDMLVADGELEAYGYTYERIKHEMENLKPKEAEDELDMFADAIDKKTEPEASVSGENSSQGVKAESSGGVEWELKWENTEDAPVHGPCSSQQMLEWSEGEYFKKGVWVRRVGQSDAPFYSSLRIDFDLYT